MVETKETLGIPVNQTKINGDELSYSEYEQQREFLTILRDPQLDTMATSVLSIIENPTIDEKTKTEKEEAFLKLFYEKIQQNQPIRDFINAQIQKQQLASYEEGILYGRESTKLMTQSCRDSNFSAAQLWRAMIRRHAEKTGNERNLTQNQKINVAEITLGREFALKRNRATFLAHLPHAIPLRKITEQDISEEILMTLSETDRTQTLQALRVREASDAFANYAFRQDTVISATENNQLSSYQNYRQYLSSTDEGRSLSTAAQTAEEAFVALLKQKETSETKTDVSNETEPSEQIYVQKTVTDFEDIGVKIDTTSIQRDKETGTLTADVTYQETPYNIQINPASQTIKIYDPDNLNTPLVEATGQPPVDGFIESYSLTIFNRRKELPQERLTDIQGDELARFFSALFPKLKEGGNINLRKEPEANIMPNLIHLLVQPETNQNKAIQSLTYISRKNDPTFLKEMKRPEKDFKMVYPNLDALKTIFTPEKTPQPIEEASGVA